MTIRESHDDELASKVTAPTEIYVLVRVSSIRSEPSVQFYPDPWRMLYDGRLYHASNVELGLIEQRQSGRTRKLKTTMPKNETALEQAVCYRSRIGTAA